MSHVAETTTSIPAVTIGLDLGDQRTHLYAVDAAGQRLEERTLATTAAGITAYFGSRAPCRVVLEVGTHSPWMSRLIAAAGHEVLVANPSAMYGRGRRRRRNDRSDAEFLARQGRADIRLLHPMTHRGAEAQANLEVLRARDDLVRTRTQLITHVRGSVKSLGARLPSSSAEAFVRKTATAIPDVVRTALAPLLLTIEGLTATIRQYDGQVAQLIATEHPVAQRLQQIVGVGPLTALSFVLLIDDPKRFTSSRSVGPYFGLVPQLDESGTSARLHAKQRREVTLHHESSDVMHASVIAYTANGIGKTARLARATGSCLSSYASPSGHSHGPTKARVQGMKMERRVCIARSLDTKPGRLSTRVLTLAAVRGKSTCRDMDLNMRLQSITINDVANSIRRYRWCWTEMDPKCPTPARPSSTQQRNGSPLVWSCACVAHRVGLHPARRSARGRSLRGSGRESALAACGRRRVCARRAGHRLVARPLYFSGALVLVNGKSCP